MTQLIAQLIGSFILLVDYQYIVLDRKKGTPMDPMEIVRAHFHPKPTGELVNHNEVPFSEVKPDFATEIARELRQDNVSTNQKE